MCIRDRFSIRLHDSTLHNPIFHFRDLCPLFSIVQFLYFCISVLCILYLWCVRSVSCPLSWWDASCRCCSCTFSPEPELENHIHEHHTLLWTHRSGKPTCILTVIIFMILGVVKPLVFPKYYDVFCFQDKRILKLLGTKKNALYLQIWWRFRVFGTLLAFGSDNWHLKDFTSNIVWFLSWTKCGNHNLSGCLRTKFRGLSGTVTARGDT